MNAAAAIASPSSRAASPKATPIANGSRAVNSSVVAPMPNQIDPQRAACSPNAPRASGGNSAAQATAASASATGGVSSQASGGEMIE